MIESSPVHDLLDGWIESGLIKCVSLLVLQSGAEALSYERGLAHFSRGRKEIDDDTVFTIASPTKTVTAVCFMQYVEEGAVSLHESVAAHLPEFGREGKDGVTFFHLLTHTAGLPEQVEGKDELRRREGGLDEFFARVCASPLLFAPGADRQYSNFGSLLMARLIEKIEGRRFGEVLAARIFEPLAMSDTALGVDSSWGARIAEIELPRGQEEERAFVNSRYWRGMGAPWGAMVSNAVDMARFAEAMRNGGELDGACILSPVTVEAMTRDRIPDLPAYRGERRPQGLAWMLQGGANRALFGDLASEATFGHHGATSTLVWVDPLREITFVFLGNKEGSIPLPCFARLSNAVVATLNR